ncbi:MAG: hypothetical protein FJW39_33050 [Acidobacteria bacterium]|nr:hypothetical protein [Acidobacteriota bacterium]
MKIEPHPPLISVKQESRLKCQGCVRSRSANFDVYNAEAYKLDLDAPAAARLQRALDAARQFHHDLYDWHTNQLVPEQRRRMLQISGVGRETLFRLEVNSGWLGLWQDVDKITARTPGDPNREGDGRVPLA